MRKAYLTLTLLLLLAGASHAQSGFNLIRSTDYPQGHLRDLIVKEDTIIGYGIGFKDTTYQEQGVFVVKIDTLGRILASTLILDPTGDLLSIDKHWGKIIPTSDGGYAMTTAAFFRPSAFLVKLDANLQMEFMKEYPDTVNLSNYYYKLREVPGGYLLFGVLERPGGYTDGFVRKVDEQGNTLWLRYLGNEYLDGVHDVAVLSDTTFIAGMVEGVAQRSYRSSFYLFNMDGQILDSWQSEPEPDIGYMRRLIPTEDGFMAYGLFVADIVGNTKIMQPALSKFNFQLQKQWVKHFGPMESINAQVTFWNFTPTPDGHYAGAGEAVSRNSIDYPRIVGWMYKFTENGDSLWSIYIDAPFELSFANGGFLSGIGALSSGSLVAGGRANEGNRHYAWLVKATPDGCVDTLCRFPLTAAEAYIPGGEGMSVFPNPSDGQFFLSLPGSYGRAPVQLELHDMNGRLLWRGERPYQERLELELPRLPRGVYLLRARLGGKAWVERVVIGK